MCEPAKFAHKVFGIGEQCNDTTDVALVGGGVNGLVWPRYHLYPRIVQENSTYLNHTVQVQVNAGNVQKIDIVLYQSDKFIYSGLRILEATCYERIVEIINASVPIVGHVNDQLFKVYGEIGLSAGVMPKIGRVSTGVVVDGGLVDNKAFF